MNRAQTRRLTRSLGQKRSPRKRGRRGAVRVPQLHEKGEPTTAPGPERHTEIIRLPWGLHVVKNREPR